MVFVYNVDMYVRTITRKNKRKPDVTYVQLAHNFRDPHTGQVRAQVLYHFGRADQLDLEALRRLVHSLSRFLPAEERLPAPGATAGPLKFLGSRPRGGAWVLRQLWERLGLTGALETALRVKAGLKLPSLVG